MNSLTRKACGEKTVQLILPRLSAMKN